MTRIPILETARLNIRPFTMNDLESFHRISDLCFGDGTKRNDAAAIEANRRMLQWKVLNEEMLAQLYQPPYGDRAVVLRETDAVIGAVGYVPCLDRFDVIEALRPPLPQEERDGGRGRLERSTLEFGLFWMTDPAHQGRGYATEAAQAMVHYAFSTLRLPRVIATTEFDNLASQGVMRKLGMRLHRNETGQPPWLQVVGVLENTAS
jgi:RimJ/RimL family protein N-acetyltransferase